MGNGNIYERLFKLWASVTKLVVEGNRDPEKVAEILQGIVSERQFPVWKTITLGLHKSAKGYRKALGEAGFKVSVWAKDIMGKPAFVCAHEETTVNLVRVKLGGFGSSRRYDVICHNARELGLELCPAEVGPALRLAYNDQLYCKWNLVAMEPVTGSDGNPALFTLGYNCDGLWLGANYGLASGVFPADAEFVFVKPAAGDK